jgi:hypothetical protein
MKKKYTSSGLSRRLLGSINAQNMQRRATMVNGGGPGQGRCTVEVVVDGGAQ